MTMHENKSENRTWGVSLFVGTNGFVWIARAITYDGTFYHLSHARTVRRWGTDKGLNQLVDGQTKETQLDALADLISVTSQAAVAIIPCRENKWANK
jgi:hypothetical protein